MRVTLIAGPTASGKTAKAIELASANDALIVNTDSMQVYGDLDIVTARPDTDEMSKAEHVLFGHVDGSDAYCVARWLADLEPVVTLARKRQRALVFAGGTGLYFNALTKGLSPIPEISREVRQRWRRKSLDTESEVLHKLLKEKDKIAEKVIFPTDTQRIIRALEVIEDTGRSIIEWQREKGVPLLEDGEIGERLILEPPREILHERINKRVVKMIDAGAMNEVKDLFERNLDAQLPVMKAIGVPQLGAHLAGEITLDQAVTKMQAATRQYAKRQSTWFRNSFGEEWRYVSC